MDDDSSFEWVADEELEAASEAELIDHVLTLQARLSDAETRIGALESEVDDLRELVYFLLEVQAGLTPETRPELWAALESIIDTDDQ